MAQEQIITIDSLLEAETAEAIAQAATGDRETAALFLNMWERDLGLYLAAKRAGYTIEVAHG